MKEKLESLICEAFAASAKDAGWSVGTPPEFVVERPKDPTHGDYATNVAMLSAKALRSNPRQIAETLKAKLESLAPDWVEGVKLAGPGFLNFRISAAGWYAALEGALAQGENFGRNVVSAPHKVLLEFVSANPTGPLHVGHARGCVVGDTLGRILRAAGHEVTTEYYVNDAGLQMDNLGRSLRARYLQECGKQIEFEDGWYQGDYIKDHAAEIYAREKDRFADEPEEDTLEYFTDEARTRIMEGIIEDMRAAGVEFTRYQSERELHAASKVDEAISVLHEKGLLDEVDGARWFRSTDFGDEKDRVVIRENGVPTYFAADIAYHREKFKRGYDQLINLWGADHHGYIARVRGAMNALGFDDKKLNIQLVQFVSLVRGGKSVSMTTRGGIFETMRDLIDEVGADATRFIFLLRSPDSSMEFDLDLATQQSMDNPVYYVQYAHARICSFFEKAREAGIEFDPATSLDAGLLGADEQLDLAREVLRYPEIIDLCARNLQAHPLPHYLMELAQAFSRYYTARGEGAPKYKVIDPENPALTQVRLQAAKAVAMVLKNGLDCLGVSAPERMAKLEEAPE
ncbi:MAG: arginine--tRNA ligase [Chrysiogenetes bacterium]|nr:arginine--tRNA ligase [Chrysiogenetes bacterium]